jgi:hypothetical protein
VEIGLEGDVLPALGFAQRPLRRLDEVADAVHIEHDAVELPRDDAAPELRDHPAAWSSGGAIAWQMATASASAS